MEIKEIVSHPAQLKHVETVSVNAKKITDKVDKGFAVSAEITGEIINQEQGKSHIYIKVSNEGYFIEEEKIGIFEFEKDTYSKEEIIKFLEAQSVRILWSYLREDIYTISSKMLPRPIMLPTIDVMKTLEKAE